MSITTTVAGGIGRVVLAHPPLNILTGEILARLRDELAALATDPSLRVLVLSAEGKHFSAGADVGEHLPPFHVDLILEFTNAVITLDSFPLPVVAGVRGRCLGGAFELVQAADCVVAGESAAFGQPEILLGVIPPAACVLLPQRLPRGVAARLVYTGDQISAADAERAGLVQAVVPDAEVESAALELAGRIARHSAAALRTAKRLLRNGRAEERVQALREAANVYLNETMETADALEGLKAFVERRAPQWAHR